MERGQLVPHVLFGGGHSGSAEVARDLSDDVGVAFGVEVGQVDLDRIGRQFAARQAEQAAGPKARQDVSPCDDIVAGVAVDAP